MCVCMVCVCVWSLSLSLYVYVCVCVCGLSVCGLCRVVGSRLPAANTQQGTCHALPAAHSHVSYGHVVIING